MSRGKRYNADTTRQPRAPAARNAPTRTHRPFPNVNTSAIELAPYVLAVLAEAGERGLETRTENSPLADAVVERYHITRPTPRARGSRPRSVQPDYNIEWAVTYLIKAGAVAKDERMRYITDEGREMAAMPPVEIVRLVTAAKRAGKRPGRKSAVPLTPDVFQPKDDSPYTAETPGRVMVKSRSHERLVRDFGEWARSQGFQPATPHPRDLVLRAAGREWLVEAKVIYDGHTAGAVRAVIGQLFDYRHFLYRASGLPDPLLLALFSEPIGKAYADLLCSLNIDPVWRDGDAWAGWLAAAVDS